MLRGCNIVCFSNDWDGDPLSKKHIMLHLSRSNRVLWVNSIGNRNPSVSARDLKRAVKKLREFGQGHRQVAENIHVFAPLVIPLYASAVARVINRWFLGWSLRRACRRLGFDDWITWTFLPTSADVVGNLGERFVVYHCVDEFSEFTGTDKNAVRNMERRLLQKADVVFVSSGPLYETKRLFNPRTFLVTHGVDIEHFRKACDPEIALPPDVAGLRHPIVGFYGLLADWVDLELVRFLAVKRPDWRFVLIGKVDTDLSPVRHLRNVHLISQKPYSLLPAYCRSFDVAILPFVVNDLTLAANPLKLREYLAAGLPVVTTDLPEARRLGRKVRVGKTYEEFLEQIELSLAEGSGPKAEIANTVREESWAAKVDEMCAVIQPLISRGRFQVPSQGNSQECEVVTGPRL
jgi:glycosyltransferase involved in cell wall biosynthesis